MIKEIWKQIKDYPDYEISNLGNVKSNLFRIPRNLKPDISTGYKRVRLSKDGKTYKWKSNHRLVGKYFVPNPNNLPLINHKDEDKLNCCDWNLEWCTHRYNIEYSLTKNGISKIKGVNWVERSKAYQCSIWHNNKKHYLGSTPDKNKAIEMVNNFLITNNIK